MEYSRLRERLSEEPMLKVNAVIEYSAEHNERAHGVKNKSAIRVSMTSNSYRIREIFGMPIKVPTVVIFDYIMN